jgi:hypothetical protein
MVEFIDAHRNEYRVELICRRLETAPSWYYALQARRADAGLVPARAERDAALRLEIVCVWLTNRRVYAAKKVWKELRREGQVVGAIGHYFWSSVSEISASARAYTQVSGQAPLA